MRFQKQKLSFKRVLERGSNKEETRDCTVRALSNATALTYDEAHEMLYRAGRKNGRGFWLEGFLSNNPILECFRITRVPYNTYLKGDWVFPSGSKGRTLKHFVQQNPIGNFILTKRGHAFAVVNGVVVDSFLPGGKCIVKSAWKVEMHDTDIKAFGNEK